MFLMHCFSRAAVFFSSAVANANPLLLITSLEMLSQACSAFCYMKSFHFYMFSVWLWWSTLTSKFLLLVFLTFFGVALVEIIS